MFLEIFIVDALLSIFIKAFDLGSDLNERRIEMLWSSLFKAVSILTALSAILGCSTSEVSPPRELPEIPAYAHVQHPQGRDLNDIHALFLTEGAPSRAEFKDCDSDFRKIESATDSIDEVQKGANELVSLYPIQAHWCFYAQILDLEDFLKENHFIEDRQSKVLEVYEFLSPMGIAFRTEFRDSRYQKWNIHHYQRLSARVFFRSVEPTPQTTLRFVEGAVEQPYPLWRAVEGPEKRKTVLERYGIVPTRGKEFPAPLVAPVPSEKSTADEDRAPASVPASLPVSLEDDFDFGWDD
jgi:hypothetical protein